MNLTVIVNWSKSVDSICIVRSIDANEDNVDSVVSTPALVDESRAYVWVGFMENQFCCSIRKILGNSYCKRVIFSDTIVFKMDENFLKIFFLKQE